MNKLRAERRGDVIEQTFYYDGKSVTLHSGSEKVYATEPAPGTITVTTARISITTVTIELEEIMKSPRARRRDCTGKPL